LAVHVFGTKGSAEVLDEVTMVLRKSGEAPATTRYPAARHAGCGTVRLCRRCQWQATISCTEADVLATLAAFEAALQSMQTGHPVTCQMAYQ